jgi:6-phosphofructokinase
MQRMGILTTGGDCSGLNASLYAIIRRAITFYRWQVFGITLGRIATTSKELKLEDAHFSLLRSGGTLIGGLSKSRPGSDATQEIWRIYQELKLNGLIATGGDGSMRILKKLADTHHIPLIVIPKTIDKDIQKTDWTIGYATAIQRVTEALDHLHTTTASHERIMIVEVMGRDGGHVALSGGIAGGADAILIPERSYNLENLAIQIKDKSYAIVVVAEGVRKERGERSTSSSQSYRGIGEYIAERIAGLTRREVRCTTLGHLQRGGDPVGWDRLLATSMGVYAVDLMAEGQRDRMVSWQNNTLTHCPLQEAFTPYASVGPQDIRLATALGLGIYLGEPFHE